MQIHRASYNQRPFQVDGWFSPMMLNAVFPVAAKIVKPEAVHIRITFVQQAVLQTGPLLGIDNTFEN